MRRLHLAPLAALSVVLLAGASGCALDQVGSEDPVGAPDRSSSSPPDDAKDGDRSGGAAGARCAVPSGRAFDLDGDGALDSNLTLEACPTKADETCLVVSSEIAAANGKTVSLGLGHAPDPSNRLATLGSLTGGPLSEVSIYTGTTAAPLRAQLLVVDPEAASVVAKSDVWSGGFAAQFVTELERGKARVPVATGQFADSAILWGRMCIFTPGFDQSPCGSGFAVWDSKPKWARNEVTYATRNNLGGGWAQDIDGDGVEDLATPYYDVVLNGVTGTYYGGFVGVSGANAKTFGMSALRFANLNPTYASLPPNFDSGRFYGVHFAYPPEAGKTSLLAVGGLPVGTFKGDASVIMCNVTRYVARIDAPLGNLTSSSFRWGYYFGFYQGVFGGSPAQYVIKEPDLLNGCLHRYADSRAVSVEGRPIVAYSLFASDTPVDNCKVEQMAFMNGGDVNRYLGCVSKNFATTGAWHVEILDENDGTKLGTANNYLWGILPNLVPDQKGSALVIESIDGKPRFDQADLVPESVGVFAARAAGGMESLGTFPVAGHPKVKQVAPPRNVGVVAQGYVELVTRPNCAVPGLVDVEMEGGGWVGWDPSTKAFVAKQ
jgi:hypothetical protein